MAVNIRLDEKIRKELKKIAEQEHRTLSNLIVKILMDYLKKQNKSPKSQK